MLRLWECGFKAESAETMGLEGFRIQYLGFNYGLGALKPKMNLKPTGIPSAQFFAK